MESIEGEQIHPEVTDLADGGYFMTWASDAEQVEAIWGRHLFPDASQEEPFSIVSDDTYARFFNFGTAGLADGSLVVTYTQTAADEEEGELWGIRYYEHDGSSTFQINNADHLLSETSHSEITALENGDFVVTWNETNEYGKQAVMGRLFDGNNGAGDIFQVSDGIWDQSQPSIAAFGDDGFVAVWQTEEWGSEGSDGRGIAARIFQNGEGGLDAGTTFMLTDELSTGIYNAAPAVADIGDGFAVTWVNRQLGEIELKIFDDNGTEKGATVVIDSQWGMDWETQPSIAGFGNGAFVVVYETYNAIEAQVFDSDGLWLGDSIFVADNVYASQNQFSPTVSATPDGKFVVTWNNNGDIYSTQIEMTATTNGDNENNVIHGSMFNNQIMGNGGNDIIKGGYGADTRQGNAGDDTFVIWGTFDANYYSGLDIAGDDLSYGNSESQLVTGDTIDGGEGSDTIVVYGNVDWSLLDYLGTSESPTVDDLESVTNDTTPAVINVENVELHSNVTYAVGQIERFGIDTITGSGAEEHIVNFVGEGVVDLSGIEITNVDEINIDSRVELILTEEQEAELTVNHIEEERTENDDEPVFGDDEIILADNEPVADEEDAVSANVFGDDVESVSETDDTALVSADSEPAVADNNGDVFGDEAGSGEPASFPEENSEPLVSDTAEDNAMDIPVDDPVGADSLAVSPVVDADIPVVHDTADDHSAVAV